MEGTFEVFYIPNLQEMDYDEASGIAFQWLREAVSKNGGVGLVIAPTQAQLQYSYVARKLVRGIRAESLRTAQRQSFPGSPVLLLWPSKDTLELVEGRSHQITALCVVEGAAKNEVDAWLRGRKAKSLLAPHDHKTVPILDPVIEQALEGLTNFVNLRNNLVTDDDKAMAYSTLQCLEKSRYRLDPEAIHAWAVDHRWPMKGAQWLRDLAQNVLDGKRIRTKSDVGFRTKHDCEQVVAFWNERAMEKAPR